MRAVEHQEHNERNKSLKDANSWKNALVHEHDDTFAVIVGQRGSK